MKINNMKSIVTALLLIAPGISQAKWESYICQIIQHDSKNQIQITGTAYLNVDVVNQNVKGTLQMWDKSVGGSFTDEVVIKGHGLKHAYLTGARFGATFEHGLGNAGSGPFNDKDLEEDTSIVSKKTLEQFIFCESIDPIVDVEKNR